MNAYSAKMSCSESAMNSRVILSEVLPPIKMFSMPSTLSSPSDPPCLDLLTLLTDKRSRE